MARTQAATAGFADRVQAQMPAAQAKYGMANGQLAPAAPPPVAPAAPVRNPAAQFAAGQADTKRRAASLNQSLGIQTDDSGNNMMNSRETLGTTNWKGQGTRNSSALIDTGASARRAALRPAGFATPAAAPPQVAGFAGSLPAPVATGGALLPPPNLGDQSMVGPQQAPAAASPLAAPPAMDETADAAYMQDRLEGSTGRMTGRLVSPFKDRGPVSPERRQDRYADGPFRGKTRQEGMEIMRKERLEKEKRTAGVSR